MAACSVSFENPSPRRGRVVDPGLEPGETGWGQPHRSRARWTPTRPPVASLPVHSRRFASAFLALRTAASRPPMLPLAGGGIPRLSTRYEKPTTKNHLGARRACGGGLLRPPFAAAACLRADGGSILPRQVDHHA